MAPTDTHLIDALRTSRDLGFLGPGPVDGHVAHAAAFEKLIPSGARVLDLGSGGGLPGLVLARLRSDLELVLVDANLRRTDFLRQAALDLELRDRVDVRTGRAEQLGHAPDLRRGADVVVSRSFGRPAVTAECAAGFLRGPGATVLVSEPPREDERAERWPAEGLALLGLRPGALVRSPDATIQVLEFSSPCPQRFPRPVGRPAKRPLF